eukprot:CAMPEP_0183429530 /NCGR_PEP_ID=MMETSP0370-20130417/48934_1 /TAXON_ID=268820 /ORGANISM="Peridinium aciculiferum, Strain PAER-2" /LENGTH=221 /DNA_ID=CAMNT_0025614599 /DNA_START=42 /DNA_END=704 /DNA_ORIENTATION=-
MAAGITSYYDLGGGQTAYLMQNQFVTRANEPRPNEFSTTAHAIGKNVRCHAESVYRPPSNAAGTSKRMGAFYEKTGVLQHRTEPGFRDMKGSGTLTEMPMMNYGTIRRPLQASGSQVLTISSRRLDDDAMSRRSRSSAASSRRSIGSMRSDAPSSVPSWVHRQPSPQPWNFESLPMYEKTSDTCGKNANQAHIVHLTGAAGKSESGFLDPSKLVETLTRRS